MDEKVGEGAELDSLTEGASWGSHGEESGSVTLAADMDNCLQAHSTLHIVLNLHHSAK